MKSLSIVLGLMIVGSSAAADPRRVATLAMDDVSSATPDVEASLPPPRPDVRHHAIYLEALGKGGLWGIGYEHTIGRRFGVGAVASFTMLGGQRMYSLTPYLLAYPLRAGHHAWFADAGVSLARIVTPSPVPEWKGTSDNGIGGELSTGYEYRDHFLFRAYAQLVAGKSGLSPWGGISIGWTL